MMGVLTREHARRILAMIGEYEHTETRPGYSASRYIAEKCDIPQGDALRLINRALAMRRGGEV